MRRPRISDPRAAGFIPAVSHGAGPSSVPCSPRRRGHRAGFSLFEVVIALLIFAGSAAAIGQLVYNGVQGSVRTRFQTDAVLRCESKLAEVVAGITPMQAVANGSFPDDANWAWTLDVQPGPYPDLYLVKVGVSRPGSSSLGNVSFSMSRLIRDPAVTTAMLEEAQQANQTSSSTSSSGSSSTGGGSGGSR